MVLQISYQNYMKRLGNLRDVMQARGLSSFLIINATNIQYFTGFWHFPTERPTLMVVPLDGDVTILTGRFELRNAKDRCPWANCVALYTDYPGMTPPMMLIADYLAKSGLNKGVIGFDQGEYRGGADVGTRGDPLISHALEPAKLALAGEIISKMRTIKDSEEISIIREASRWGNLALSCLQDNIELGLTESEISLKAEYQASKPMLRAMPPEWEPFAHGGGPVHVFMKAGPSATLSHRSASNRRIQMGDVIYANSAGLIYGYSDELERTIFVGEPDEKKRKYHAVTLRAQDAAIKAIKPGAMCSDVDKAAIAVLKEANMMQYVYTHTGHAKGLQPHEAPFLDEGDNTLIEEGMVFTPEPKILVPDLGHFGHSDTVVVTKDGCDVITYYPRDTESLIVRLRGCSAEA
ncbi:MAG: M24 family metallopeptidase [Nitrososphaerales archaeon]